MLKRFIITNERDFKKARDELYTQLRSLNIQGYIKYSKQLSSDEWLFEVQVL